MARLSHPPTAEECEELSQLQECYHAELMKHASMKTLLLDQADLLAQTRSRNSRMRSENVGMKLMTKDIVMGRQPYDLGNYDMPDDDGAFFVNLIAELLKGALEEDDSIALEPAYVAKLVQQVMTRSADFEAGQAWASLAHQDAVREGSRGAASGISMESSLHSTLESRVFCSGGAYPGAEQQPGRQPTMVTPRSELQQTKPSLPPTRLPQKDVEADVKSTSKKSGRKGAMTRVAVPFPVGLISSSTSPLPVEVKPDARSQGGKTDKGKKQNVAVPPPVGYISPPTSLLPVAELSVASAAFLTLPAPLLSATPLARLRDPLPVVPLPAQSTALSSGVCPVISSAPVAVGTERGSISNACGDGPIPENPVSSLGDISGSITTLVIRHIPGEILQSQLMQRWPVTSIGYNMFYAPFNQRKRRSMGFAFMNFTSHSALLEFHLSWHGVVLGDGPNSKGLNISAAAVQGLEANIQRMSRSKLIKSIKRIRHMPIIVEADGNVADFRKLMTVAMHEEGGSQEGADSVHEEEDHDESVSGPSDAAGR